MDKGGIQLPDDAVAVDYKKVRPYQWAQVFFSRSKQFIGTEQEFINAGYAYRYVQIDRGKRVRLDG